ncbi:hypothetical protein HMPREF1314_0479 [Bifidobacterium longum subsp. longum 35B]|nr:hypothetical protein HMPREF1314_0479 [Bifidobacterium longum subsp. longum 35B]
MLIPSFCSLGVQVVPSLSRRVNANSQQVERFPPAGLKLIKKGEC